MAAIINGTIIILILMLIKSTIIIIFKEMREVRSKVVKAQLHS
jgi:hypothetical protein